ncbi:heme ABC transporter ATP-binding protein [Lewinella sp. W8]|uniref:heme ABC transporter ATP-binding protein n=1 Tax=Lewinella sp. W8 TaxID=2528208 RepID=UPI001067A1C3|nr:heme ABC transporter ATP-binding protein [Lewinella sp. W8]MTB53143.1 heme ABC transporter ATP-binding protein [Lewinella sp. W8]
MMQARNITLRLGGRDILKEVSCRVRPGRVTVIMGKNGAGKSTLLNCMAGSLGADAGAVYLDGQSLQELSPEELSRRRAVLAQSYSLGFPISVAEVVEMGCYGRYYSYTARERKNLVREYLQLLDLEPFAHRAFPTLSGGEQKRVMLAKCLLQLDEGQEDAPKHRYLLLDEPTAALDVEQQFRFVDLATKLARQRGLGVLAVLHDLNIAARFADEILFLREGQTVTMGPTKELLNKKTIKATFDVDCLIQDHPYFGGPLITTLPYGASIIRSTPTTESVA